jgi:hypothetical protein
VLCSLVVGLGACGSADSEPGPMTLNRVEVLDAAGRELEVTVLGPMCFEVASTRADEDEKQVRVLVRGAKRSGCEITDDRGVFYRATVDLESALADREVIDDSCPHPRPTEGEGGCGMPLEVVRGSAPEG